MNYTLLIRPEAELDIKEAYQHYEGLQRGLGSEMVRAVDASLSKIFRNPLGYPLVHQDIRRTLIRRFPYGLFYTIDKNRIIVLAFFHTKRDPKRWQELR